MRTLVKNKLKNDLHLCILLPKWKWTKWYAMTLPTDLPGTHTLNCFLDDFNCVFRQIHSLKCYFASAFRCF